MSRERRKILVLSREEAFSAEVMDYAIFLAERLDFSILALNVFPFGEKTRDRAEFFLKSTLKAARKFQERAMLSGIECEHRVKFGNLLASIEELKHEMKRIEFVVTDSEKSRMEIAEGISIPVFGLVTNRSNQKGENIMANSSNLSSKQQIAKTLGLGVVTLALYAAVFAKADTVMHLFARGGWYAALPIGTVFVFSFIHGSFASSLWSLMGIEAKKQDSLRKVDQKTIQKKKVATKRPRAYAYVNPFHRM
ncbi:hypothetical protein [Desulforhabdus amnigena]|uniref:hypothetical protein n=1 Tax=Desulforhabdus amnigena TaxID=40218 RepID=UPI0024925A07|nr:hypothetical protein [Desulforhabdus amnigena]